MCGEHRSRKLGIPNDFKRTFRPMKTHLDTQALSIFDMQPDAAHSMSLLVSSLFPNTLAFKSGSPSLYVPGWYYCTCCLQNDHTIHIIVWSQSDFECDWEHGVSIKIKSHPHLHGFSADLKTCIPAINNWHMKLCGTRAVHLTPLLWSNRELGLEWKFQS